MAELSGSAHSVQRARLARSGSELTGSRSRGRHVAVVPVGSEAGEGVVLGDRPAIVRGPARSPLPSEVEARRDLVSQALPGTDL